MYPYFYVEKFKHSNMKTAPFILGTYFIVTVFFALTACHISESSSKEISPETSIAFDSISTSQTHFYQNDSSHPFYQLNLDIVYPTADKQLKQLFSTLIFADIYTPNDIHETVNAYFLYNAQSFDKEIATIPSGQQSVKTTGKDNLSGYTQIERIRCAIKYRNEDILSLQTTRSLLNENKDYIYSSCKNYVINCHSYQLLNEDSLFNKGYRPILRSLMIQKLLDKHQVRTTNELEDIGFFALEDITPNGNFFINTKGVTYTFNPGEIAIPSLGKTNITLPFNELNSLLKADSPLHPFMD